jgi:GNAT superfamily N-acetyltransferase
MSMYKDYVETQLPNRFVYEDEKGFLTYRILDKTCVLEEIYVVPEWRRKGIATEYYKMMEDIAKENNCNCLRGFVGNGINGSEGSLKCLLKSGFEIHSTTGEVLILIKEIGE